MRIKRAAVLGAGVMGAQIAAHLANAGIPSLLLDLPGAPARNKIAADGLARAVKMKPAPFFIAGLEKLVTVGNFEDDLKRIADADWIVEAVAEKLEIKRSLFQKVAALRKPDAIVSTNTSGIRISEIAAGLDESFRSHFVGAHFFNPPRYMRLLEIIPTADTLPEVIDAISAFGRDELGKEIVRCKDTPNFIANRIGTLAVCLVLRAMLDCGLTIEEVDDLTGPAIGRPKSATFRTLDLVGIDTFAHVAENLYDAVPSDEMREYFKLPGFIGKMVSRGLLGEKTGQGFYKKVKSSGGESEILTLDLQTMEYRPRQKSKIASSEMAKTPEGLDDKLKILATARDKGGEFFWRTMAGTLVYAASRVPEISDSVVEIDRAMTFGFNWEVGPFRLWERLGFDGVGKKAAELGFSVPAWVSASGKKSFYPEGAAPDSDPKAIELRPLKSQPGKIVKQNAGASLIDIGDRILCFEFHSKMNTVGEDTLSMADEAFRRLDAPGSPFDGMVIGNQGENFCAGANLMLILMLAQEEEWDDLDRAIRLFQKMTMSIKYATKPVVVAPFGLVLGGGCEIALHGPRVCAGAESYMGLVEIGAGVIPAGGGTKEMVCRASTIFEANPQEGTKPFEKAFETIALAKISTSAAEAKALGYLRESDSIRMNPAHLLHDAKQAALSMIAEGYRAPAPQLVTAMGKSLYANLLVGIYQMREAGRITEYEEKLGKKLAHIMAGGDFSSPQRAPERHFLDLEREAFLSLVGERKTQERMQHLLKRGRPLRN